MTVIARVNQNNTAASDTASQEPVNQEVQESDKSVYLAASLAFFALLNGTTAVASAAKEAPRPASILVRGFRINNKRENVAVILEDLIAYRLAYLWGEVDVINRENVGRKLSTEQLTQIAKDILHKENSYDKMIQTIDADFSITGNIGYSLDLSLEGEDENFEITLELWSKKSEKPIATQTFKVAQGQMKELLVCTDKALTELVKALNSSAQGKVTRQATTSLFHKDAQTDLFLRIFWHTLAPLSAPAGQDGKKPDPDSLRIAKADDFALPPEDEPDTELSLSLDMPFEVELAPLEDTPPPPAPVAAPPVSPAKIAEVKPPPVPAAVLKPLPSPQSPEVTTSTNTMMMWSSGALAVSGAVLAGIGSYQSGKGVEGYNEKLAALIAEGKIAGTPGDYRYTSFEAKAQHAGELKAQEEIIAGSDRMFTLGLAGAVVMTGLAGWFYKLQSDEPADKENEATTPLKASISPTTTGAIMVLEFNFK